MQSVLCPSGWTYYSNKCYTMSTNKANYNSATSICKAYNATLAIPNSADEHSFLYSTMTLGEETLVILKF